MSLTEETLFNPATLSRSDTFSSSLTAGKTLPNTSIKIPKSSTNYPRIDFEPLYVELKVAIGHNWPIYHDALTRFIRAELSAVEFSDLADNFILANPATEHAHNSLICAIIFNITRDSPDSGPAAWVSAASDKAAAGSTAKPAITSDAGEQRLKVEIKSILPRDRRRIKGILTDKTEDEVFIPNTYEAYYQAGKIRAPEHNPTAAAGVTKTNWEAEIKRRYTQQLFAETLEFPDANTILGRIMPICYEESVPAGSTMQCAEYIALAAESFLKDFLSGIFSRTRSNGPILENGLGGGGIHTAGYKKQLVREESDFKAGKIQRSRDTGLLPIEAREASTRQSLGMLDLKVASTAVKGLFNGMPLIGRQIFEAPHEAEQEEWRAERAAQLAILQRPGYLNSFEPADDPMEVDEDDWGWAGSGAGDKAALESLLEDCLAIRA